MVSAVCWIVGGGGPEEEEVEKEESATRFSVNSLANDDSSSIFTNYLRDEASWPHPQAGAQNNAQVSLYRRTGR